MKKLLLLALLMGNAQAETFITTTVASYHSDRESEYNEFNPGLGVRHDGYIAGCYENSHSNPACYAGYEFRQPSKYVDFALQLGGVTGYKNSQLYAPSVKGIYMFALPSIVIGDDVQYKIGIIPVDDWTLTFQIDWRI